MSTSYGPFDSSVTYSPMWEQNFNKITWNPEGAVCTNSEDGSEITAMKVISYPQGTALWDGDKWLIYCADTDTQKFKGWSTQQGGGEDARPYERVISDTNLYPIYIDKDEHMVTLNFSGYQEPSVGYITVLDGNAISVEDVREQYRQVLPSDEWYFPEVFNVYRDPEMTNRTAAWISVTEDIDVYVKADPYITFNELVVNTYNAKFDPWWDESRSALRIPYSELQKLGVPVPSQEGAVFDHWQIEHPPSKGSAPEILYSDTDLTRITIEAPTSYTPIFTLNQYKIVFEGDEYCTPTKYEIKVNHGDVIDPSEHITCSRPGYTFKGWEAIGAIESFTNKLRRNNGYTGVIYIILVLLAICVVAWFIKRIATDDRSGANSARLTTIPDIAGVVPVV